MQSFRTEIENPVVEKDIIELANKIEQFKEGKIDEEKFWCRLCWFRRIP